MASKIQIQLGTALEARLHGLRHALSDKEQRVADFLLAVPKEFLSLSISALATRCGVSETVIIRLYRKLGFQGFHEFKIEVAQSLTETVPDEGIGDLHALDSMETIMRKVVAIHRKALEDAIPSLDEQVLKAVRDRLFEARHVLIYAFGGSAPVGADLMHKLVKVGIVATMHTDPHMQIMASAVLGPADLLFAISHSGSSRDIIEALHLAKQRGAHTVLMTGSPRSPATRETDLCLHAVVRETEHLTDVMTSRFVQLAVVDMLYVSMIFANKERALANVHDTSVAAAKKKL